MTPDNQQTKTGPIHNTILKALALLLCVIFPLSTLCEFNMLTSPGFSPDTMWCGVYGCILACLCWRSTAAKAAAIIINCVPFALFCVGFLMGGVTGPLYLLLHAVLPFIPWSLIF